MKEVSYIQRNPMAPKDAWDSLSIADKAAMMRVAVQNGITNLDDIRQKYNEFAEGGNIYAGGSYMPSEGIKKRISKWEGKAMTGAKDPLSGKFLKNNSFESEAAAFTRAIPESIREQVLSNPELADNLFSYSYNVGAPKFKKRVVKALEDYYAGKGTAKKIADSMWASGDVKLRGLRNRRAEEKKGVMNALKVNIPAVQVSELPVSTAVVNPFIIPAENTMYFPQVTPVEDNYVEVQEITPEQRRAEQVRNTFDAINNYNMMMDMLSVPNNPQPMYVPKNAPYVVRGFGGPIVEAAMNEYKKGGGIHIKHPGRLTALKKRTGKTEAELYNDGNPAHKKMVVFARNARKWKHELGGNLFSGEEENSQQMNIFRRPNGEYFYQASPDSEEVSVTPLNTLFDNPALWTYTDNNGKIYTPRQAATPTQGTITQKEEKGPIVEAARKYFGELQYDINNGIPIGGKYTLPAIAAAAALPVVGEAAAPVLANPYVDAGITSAFAGHGLNHWINEGIDGLGDAAMTTLEVTPLGRLARPMWNAGKEGLQYSAKVADNAVRYASPSYDLYRTISETTPRTTPTYRGVHLNGEQAYTGSPLFEFGQTMGTSPEKAYFMRAPKDVDVLKLGNGKFRHEVVGNEILPSGEVNGKFVSYGEPWQEFALGENSALYEFPVGSRRGPSLMATDWKGRPQKYSVDEVYDYMQQEEALRKELAPIKETMGDDFLRQYSTIKRNLINEKYPALKEHIDTSVHGANQTVIPNERWNFDKFLRTPFWKYSENPISGQVQKELMMRWPEAKPLETPTIEWADAARTPQITAENAANYTPKVNWNADNWFKTISGRDAYSSEEAAELASHVPEYRAIEQKLFDKGKLTYDSNGNIIVNGSDMSPQEYIMRQSAAFQKMNPEHHYVGVSKGLRHNFENEARDPNTRNRYEVWTDRKSPKNVEEYAQSQQGGYTNDSQIETIEHQMAIREENHDLHKEQLKWKLDHGKISQENYDRDLAALEDMYNWKQKVAEDKLKALRQQKASDPLNGGKVFDVTYPKETAETPIINAENNHWARIPFDNVVRDAPSVVTHYKQRPYSNELQTDQIISAARRNGYGVTHIDNVMDTYDGTMLNETIIGRDTPIKSVLGNTGTFDIESPNKWRLYRSLLPPFLSLGTLGSLYGTSNR